MFASLSLTYVLIKPLFGTQNISQAAGPLFVAAADFQRQISSSLGTEALKFMSVLLHIMEPYVNGFSYQSSINERSLPLGISLILLSVVLLILFHHKCVYALFRYVTLTGILM